VAYGSSHFAPGRANLDDPFFNYLFAKEVELERERKANCMEPSERERLLKLYYNRDLLGWFNEQVWTRIAQMGEGVIRQEYPGAIERAESIRKERPSEGKDAYRRTLMGALRRACKDEFVKKSGQRNLHNASSSGGIRCLLAKSARVST